MSINTRTAATFLALSLLTVGGCWPRPAPQPDPEPQVSAAQPFQAKIEPEVDPAATPPIVLVEAIVEELAQARGEPQRLLVFTSEGPLRVDVRLWIDGQPFHAALEALIDHVLTLADSDGDGTATWKELAEHPDLRGGQLGNLSFEDPRERSRLVNLYDTNRNGWVDRDEVPRLVSRNRGKSQAFSIRPTSFAAPRSRADSPLRLRLDADGDGLISAAEMASAEERLWQRDLDDDEMVAFHELQEPSTAMGMDESRSRRRFFGRPAAFTLDEHTTWGDVLAALEDETALLAELDTDVSGSLSREELGALAHRPALLQIEIRFGQRKADKSRLLLRPTNLEPGHSQHAEQEVAVELGTDQLVFRVRDGVNSEAITTEATNLLSIYDGDRNNYLAPDELPDEFPDLNFAAADKDGDEKLFVEEVETFLANRNWIQRCQVRMQGLEGEDPLLRVVDTNGDRRISAREMAGLEANLGTLDRNASGSVEYDELPAAIVFEFFRGNDDENNLSPVNFVATTRILPVASPSAPAWFTGMDYNNDGDISPREFLGTPRQFVQLDTNDDGFLSPQEAATASP